MHSRGRHRKPGKTAKIIAPGVTAGAIVALAGTGAHAQVISSANIPREAVQTSAKLITYVPRHAQKGVTVRPGDSLSAIAARECNNPGDWTGIWNYNHKTLHWNDPDIIQQGQRVIPDCRREQVWLPQPAVTTADVSYSARHAYSAPQGRYVPAGAYSYSGLESLWESAGGPAWAAASAATIAECESGGRANAYNPSGATGIWQILGEVVPGNLDDPYTNALNAVSKFRASGDTFAQWVCQA